MKVKVIGAGSIGNHLTEAARRMGWSVALVDADPDALRRTKEDIYPTRYGTWDSEIELFTAQEQPRGGFDAIFIGTPPDVRMAVAKDVIKERPRLVLFEKPLCAPSQEGLAAVRGALVEADVMAVVGYDHALAESVRFVVNLLETADFGVPVTLDVEFREHWGGILGAHPWLAGPASSYLGYAARGGGAASEHSHALHLWQYLARCIPMGKIVSCAYAGDVRAKDWPMAYDAVSSFALTTDAGLMGRVVQDVVTRPARKWFRIQFTEGFIEWHCNVPQRGDIVRWQTRGMHQEAEGVFQKTRRDDFWREMLHIDDLLQGRVSADNSPIGLDGALTVMNIISSAFHVMMQSGKRTGSFGV